MASPGSGSPTTPVGSAPTTPVGSAPTTPVGSAPTTPGVPPGGGSAPTPGETPGQDPGPDRGSSIGWGLGLIAAGILWLVWLSGVDIPWERALPIVLIGIGLLLLARPRAEGGGLIALGVVLVVLGLAQPGLPVRGSFTAGEQSHTITDAADLDRAYALGAGTLVLDLRDLDVTEGPVELTGRVTLGELIVRVPEGVRVTGDARVVMGEVAHFGREDGGINPSVDIDDGPFENDVGATPDDGVIDVDLRVVLGQIEVQR
jgi:hypothetical protein